MTPEEIAEELCNCPRDNHCYGRSGPTTEAITRAIRAAVAAARADERAKKPGDQYNENETLARRCFEWRRLVGQLMLGLASSVQRVYPDPTWALEMEVESNRLMMAEGWASAHHVADALSTIREEKTSLAPPHVDAETLATVRGLLGVRRIDGEPDDREETDEVPRLAPSGAWTCPTCHNTIPKDVIHACMPRRDATAEEETRHAPPYIPTAQDIRLAAFDVDDPANETTAEEHDAELSALDPEHPANTGL